MSIKKKLFVDVKIEKHFLFSSSNGFLPSITQVAVSQARDVLYYSLSENMRDPRSKVAWGPCRRRVQNQGDVNVERSRPAEWGVQLQTATLTYKQLILQFFIVFRLYSYKESRWMPFILLLQLLLASTVFFLKRGVVSLKTIWHHIVTEAGILV